MSWDKNLENLKKNITQFWGIAEDTLHNIFFLIYSIIYEFNSLFYYINRSIHNNARIAAITAAIILTLFEFYIATTTLTAMTVFTMCMVAIPAAILIWSIIFYTSAAINKYYEKYWKGKYLTKLKSNNLTDNGSLHIKALAIFIALAIFMLVVGPPMLNLITPVVAFVLKDAVLGLSAATTWLFHIGYNILHTALLGLQHGGAEDIMLVISIFAIPFYILGGASLILASIISYLGHTYATILLANLIIIAPILYGMYQDNLKTRSQNGIDQHTDGNIRHHMLLQLSLLARTAVTATIGITVLKICTPALIILMAPYATYIMAASGSIVLGATVFSGKDNILSATFLAIAYSVTTCFFISHYSVAFILAPQMLSIILAVGSGIIGAEILFRATTFIGNGIINNVFNEKSTIATMRNDYRAFVDSCIIATEVRTGKEETDIPMAQAVVITG